MRALENSPSSDRDSLAQPGAHGLEGIMMPAADTSPQNAATIKGILACAGAIVLAFFLVQGWRVNLGLFMTPWHHDDFGAPYAFDTLPSWQVRPVLAYLVAGLAAIDGHVYYTGFLFTSFAALFAIFAFVMVSFQIHLGSRESLAAAFVGALVWYSLPSSLQSLQYGGLFTNALSIVLGMSTALLITVYCRKIDERPWLLGAIVVLTLLTAFSKEDMVVFLPLVTAFWGFKREASGQHRSRLAVLMLMAAIVGIFALSLTYSKWLGSPFIGGSGPYDTSNWAWNTIENASRYATASQGQIFVILVSLLIFIAALWRLRSTPELATPVVRLAFVCACAAALAAPYLPLPRHFDYYSMNFIPLITFSLVPGLTLCIAGLRPLSALGSFAVGITCSIIWIAVFIADFRQNYYAINWLTMVRERSHRQIASLRLARSSGLNKCRDVLVTGTSQAFGPFISTGSAFLRHALALPAENWMIVAEPDSIAWNFASTRTFGADWQYVESASLARKGSCRLEYDKDTFAAKLSQAQ